MQTHHSTFNIQHSTTQQINHRHFSSKLCQCLRPLAVALQWPLRISTTHSLSELPRKKLGTAEQFSISRIGIAGTKLVAVKHHHTLILHSNKASKAERRVEWRRASVICKQWEERKERKETKRQTLNPHTRNSHTLNNPKDGDGVVQQQGRKWGALEYSVLQQRRGNENNRVR